MNKWNYFDTITVTETSFPVSPQANFHFHSMGFSFTITTSGTIEYSFDGINIHGNLDGSSSTLNERFFDNRLANKVWFKVSSGSEDVRVESWGSIGR